MFQNKVAIGSIIHYPSKQFVDRILLAETIGIKSYVFDNSPTSSLFRDWCKTKNNCKYYTLGKNVGLGIGLSSICSQAYYDGQIALLYFDQDTKFNKSTLEFIEKIYIDNPHLLNRYSAIVFNSKNYKINKKASQLLKDVLLARSSGSLFFLDNLKKINWHNEKYFVDCVDYEFCLRSNINNYKIGECSVTPGFDHEREQPDKKYCVFGKEILLRKYSKERIIDTTMSSLRLLLTSISFRKIKFSLEIIRSYSLNLGWQFLVRFLNLFERIDN